ncbi:MAG: hypothetical protein PSV23_12615 [Brevundimonas sp.]|uniref:hypothetical protein n=1 Tax=Brevundimonas sp. TaxID=1871086 RepID=UPI002489D428|nr:hypothetical protein [Brevundimonas sp.]MDI1327627.1 hypothetical protein [Brevundimonas sp.]
MPDGSHTAPPAPLPAPDPFPPTLRNWREDGRGRRTAPDEVWTAARDDYLAGMSAPEVCARHDVRLSTLRQRAVREGWRRVDQPWSPRNRLDPDDEGVELEARIGGDLDKVELRELSWVAARRMMRAVLRGDATDALRWRRVREAMDAEDAEMDRLMEQQEAIWASRRGHAADVNRGDAVDAVDAVDGVDGVDGVFPRPRPSCGRRRLAKRDG